MITHLFIFIIYLVSFTVYQPLWLCRQNKIQKQKQKQTSNKTTNYETDTNRQKPYLTSPSGGFYLFRRLGSTGKGMNI
jgi:type IV secretory pathway TraG/TraD family ATPase VirD4